MKIIKEQFGITQYNEKVYKYKLINDFNSFVSILNYGGIITEIYTPDKEGKLENLVLGFDNFKDYEEKSPHFGAITGRNAGRISNAQFNIDDIVYTLPKNNNNNNLHGGPVGLDKKIWNVEEFVEKDSVCIKLSHISIDGDQGFPGNLHLEVIYNFNNNNELEIIYSARTDKKTIVNLTNHSYFNLSGNLKEDILDEILNISSDKICCIDRFAIPTGEIRYVKGGAFDFNQPKIIGKDINSNDVQIVNVGGYDHPFLLNEDVHPQIVLQHEKSGRTLEIVTDQPVVVVYSGNSLNENLTLKHGVKSRKYLGICFETQNYVDAINQRNFPNNILKPGDVYKAYTKYTFKTY